VRNDGTSVAGLFLTLFNTLGSGPAL
jgi:hypothetical protein